MPKVVVITTFLEVTGSMVPRETWPCTKCNACTAADKVYLAPKSHCRTLPGSHDRKNQGVPAPRLLPCRGVMFNFTFSLSIVCPVGAFSVWKTNARGDLKSPTICLRHSQNWPVGGRVNNLFELYCWLLSQSCWMTCSNSCLGVEHLLRFRSSLTTSPKTPAHQGTCLFSILLTHTRVCVFGFADTHSGHKEKWEGQRQWQYNVQINIIATRSLPLTLPPCTTKCQNYEHLLNFGSKPCAWPLGYGRW